MKEKELNKSESALREEKVLEFWEKNQIFQKSMSTREGGKEFVFYEGPPTANGTPGIHHLEARAFKDIIPRYKTMRGFHVRRKGGWDTHGLPVELQVEKKLGLNSKKAIEEYGIDKFNTECKKSVWEYLEFWNSFTKRIGYWVDQENPYITYENNYIESVWNVIKEIDKQNLLFKDYKVVPWCPRCGTTLSSHELAQGYEDVKDLSLYVKFKVKNEVNTFILAWTTTPWTLPGNVALAVGEDIDYVKVVALDCGNKYIFAKELFNKIKEKFTSEIELVSEFKGAELIGLEYEPLFPYLENTISEEQKDKLSNAFKVYGADFVTTEDGTGIVHTAVMYGADDFNLGNEIGLPKHHLVNLEGKFIVGTAFLEGRFVKEKDEKGKPTLDVDIIKYLQDKNLFFHKELYEHSYPHCWRCKTALIYYARDSWYIRMSDSVIKKKMIEENKSINWEPEHIREGRFGEWLAGIKDWAISRERYWGTPLPIWLSEDGEKLVVDSIEAIRKYGKKSGNKYFVMRHGEAKHNLDNRISYKDENENDLTEKGIEQIKETLGLLKQKNITKIFYSPFLRTKRTAEILFKELDIDKNNFISDDRLVELNPGIYDGSTWEERNDWAYNQVSYYHARAEGGESHQDAKNRFGDFLYDIDSKNTNENILIVTHGIGLEVLPAVSICADEKESFRIYKDNPHTTGDLLELDFNKLPHNENFELDLHRPYIDSIVLEKEGKEYKRVKEVMDVWFDSGAMPFAQDHFPFEEKEISYPADFISEAIDQTRGWFYTLHAVGILMGRGKAYKNVICLGHLLDAKGKKMSKSLGNIVDPWIMMDKYGVDTLRLWMYSVNQPGESKNFDEKTVVILHSQVFGLLYNVLAFYELYRDKDLENNNFTKSENILDIWILARFNELVELTTKNLDNYKVLEPARAIRDFIGDLSTWYLRRSRDRIKYDDKEAKQTLYFVLKNLAKILAPFAPFSTEDIWQRLKNDKDEMSVHLANWPEVKLDNQKVLDEMNLVRKIVSIGLNGRLAAGFDVKQTLSEIRLGESFRLSQNLCEIIKDELNIEIISFIKDCGEPNVNDKNWFGVIGLLSMPNSKMLLNIEITPNLKLKGDYRKFLRSVQDLRKKEKLVPADLITLFIKANKEGQDLVLKFENDFKKVAGIREIKFTENDGVEFKIAELVFKIKIEK